MADLIKTNGEIVRDVDISSLKKKQDLVGGLIEYCPVDKHSFMYVNERGLLEQLDVNHRASGIAGQMVVGDVILCLNDEVE